MDSSTSPLPTSIPSHPITPLASPDLASLPSPETPFPSTDPSPCLSGVLSFSLISRMASSGYDEGEGRKGGLLLPASTLKPCALALLLVVSGALAPWQPGSWRSEALAGVARWEREAGRCMAGAGADEEERGTDSALTLSDAQLDALPPLTLSLSLRVPATLTPLLQCFPPAGPPGPHLMRAIALPCLPGWKTAVRQLSPSGTRDAGGPPAVAWSATAASLTMPDA